MVFTFCWSIDIKVYVQNIVIFINEHCHLVPNTAWAVSGYSEAKLWSVWNAPWFIFVGAPALNWKRPLSWKKWMSHSSISKCTLVISLSGSALPHSSFFISLLIHVWHALLSHFTVIHIEGVGPSRSKNTNEMLAYTWWDWSISAYLNY